jgi:hypothetical protein
MTQNGYTPAPPAPAPTPGRLGQGTAIEQARVWAEVAASVELARIAPRTTHRALTLMRESCAHPRLAERAFYRYPRGGETVSGSTVQLARELARCFGHIHYGAVEMRRDDDYRQSELMAWAWDVEQGVRASTIFIVPHRRDTKRGSVDLVDLRDIYENNANLAARRLREMIKDVLPPWYVAEAEELCLKTLEHGGGKPLAARRADAVALFGNQFGVTADQIVQKFNGRKVDDWTPFDLAQLTTIYQSLRMGTVKVADEFPAERVTVEEIVNGGGVPQPPPAAPETREPETRDPDEPEGAGVPRCGGCGSWHLEGQQCGEEAEAGKPGRNGREDA